MSEDTEALQGLWKIESIKSRGQNVSSSVAYWEFEGDRVQEIVPYFVDGGPWGTFTLDTTTTPRHLDIRYSTTDPGTDETTERTYKYAYELNGDTLRVGGAQVYGYYPEVIDENYSTVTTLIRSSDSRPETKKASGKLPLESPVLGAVTWKDDYDQWEAAFALAPDKTVRVTLQPLEGHPDQTIAVGEALVTWAKTQEPDVRAYAAAELIALAEDWRDEDEEPDPITPESFAARIRLESLSSESNGSATFWYHDDEIFAGHVIAVSVNADREFADAQIMG